MPFKQFIREVDHKGEYWEGQSFDEHVALCDVQLTRDTLLQSLPEDMPILEAGCGLGRWVVYLRQRGYNVFGVDLSYDTLRRCRANADDCPVVVGNILAMPFRDGTFGAILSFGVAEHLEREIGAAFNEMKRLLRPEGVLLLAVPCTNVLRRFFVHPYILARNMFRKLRKIELVFAEYRYTRYEVTRLVEKHGFEAVAVHPDDLRLPCALGLSTDLKERLSSKERKFELNWFGLVLERLFRSISPWISCEGVFCVAKRRGPSTR